MGTLMSAGSQYCNFCLLSQEDQDLVRAEGSYHSLLIREHERSGSCIGHLRNKKVPAFGT